MDNKKLKGIVDIFNQSGLTAMEINEKEGENEFSIKLEKKGEPFAAAAAPALTLPQLPVRDPAEEAAEHGIKDFNTYRDVKSPMVGIFYAAPSPDSDPFIKVGDRVKKGDTLCIIEAMKLMNDVVAEEDGEVVEICAENGSLVEFGQVLFKIF